MKRITFIILIVLPIFSCEKSDKTDYEEEIKELSEAWLERDTSGRYEPFWATIDYVLKQFY